MRPSGIVFGLLIPAAIFAGCLGAAEPQDAAIPEEASRQFDAGASAPSPGWRREESVVVALTAAVGVPYAAAHWMDPGSSAYWLLPNGTTRMTVFVNASLAGGDGVGQVTFVLGNGTEARYADGSSSALWFGPDAEIRDSSIIRMDNPSPGGWRAWIWPKGLVLNQDVLVSVVAIGVGAEPESLSLSRSRPE